MSKTTQSIIDMVDSNPDVDNSDTFQRLWALTCKMKDRVAETFELHADDSTAQLQPYKGLPDSGGAEGFLSTFAGPDIDWLVHSWVGNPKFSFTNMHLTISLSAKCDVPNLGLAFGTTPDLFFYMDYLPRKDLWVNPDYMERYYSEANADFLALHNNENITSFISQSLYVRVAQSASSLCVSAPMNEDNFACIEENATRMFERWLAWASKAEEQPESLWAAQAQRDEAIRRHVAELDPVNDLAVRLFGAPLTERLIEALWSGGRALPRAHQWQ